MDDEQNNQCSIFDAIRGINVNSNYDLSKFLKTAFEQLKNAGVHLHLFHGQKELYIHAKIIIADSSTLFLVQKIFLTHL